MTSARAIVVYHDTEAADYARLIRRPRGHRLDVHVCATPAEAGAVMAGAEVLYAWGFPGALLARAPRLRWVQVMGAGVDRFLDAPASVVLTRAAGTFGPWMAEYTLGWCLWLTQRTEQFREQQRARRWREVSPLRLRGATLCVVGLGEIGRAIARVARVFGMTVVGVNRSGHRVREAHRAYPAAALPAALALADFAVLTVPLTPETRSLVGQAALAAMKPTAWLINIARGGVLDEAALLDALASRRIAGAILDVFATEPLPPEHPLWELDNVVVTPHIAGPSTPAEISVIFNDNLRRYLSGRPLRHVVDRRRGY